MIIVISDFTFITQHYSSITVAYFFNPGSCNSERLLRESDVGKIAAFLVPCAAKWRLIGIALGIIPGILTNIEVKPVNIAGAPSSYLIDTLTYWMNNMSGTTKTALTAALRNILVNEGKLAQELEKADI